MASSANITRTLFTVADFVAWQRDGSLNLSPSFQRRPVWKPQAKSYLIDTVVRGLPTPIIFLRQITDVNTLATIREVVDGQQRIRTLLSYIDQALFRDWNEELDPFQVSRQHNPEIAGVPFNLLDQRVKRAILGYQFSVHVLPNDTSDQQVLDIFRRMNATGTKLNKQELRNAEFFGEFIQSVYSVSLRCLDLWRRWGVFSEDNIARMEEAEFVSELYIMMLSGVSSKSQPLINRFYRDNDIHFDGRSHLESRLIDMLTDLDSAYGDQMNDSQFSNRIILYPLLAAIYDLVYGFGSDLTARANKRRISPLARALPRLDRRLANRDRLPENVQEALLSRPGHRANREALTDYIKEHLSV